MIRAFGHIFQKFTCWSDIRSGESLVVMFDEFGGELRCTFESFLAGIDVGRIELLEVSCA